MSLRDLDADTYKTTLAHVLESVREHVLRECVYLLDFGPAPGGKRYYKFGRTSNILDRMKTHFRKHHFYEVVKVVACDNAVDAEARIRTFASNNCDQVTKYGETEMIATCDVAKYVDFMLALSNTPVDTSDDMEIDNADDMEVEMSQQYLDAVFAITQAHNKALANIREHTCRKCGHVFGNKSSLMRHENRKTPCTGGVKTQQHRTVCTLCNKTFCSTNTLNRHHKTCKLTSMPMKMNIMDMMSKTR